MSDQISQSCDKSAFMRGSRGEVFSVEGEMIQPDETRDGGGRRVCARACRVSHLSAALRREAVSLMSSTQLKRLLTCDWAAPSAALWQRGAIISVMPSPARKAGLTI